MVRRADTAGHYEPEVDEGFDYPEESPGIETLGIWEEVWRRPKKEEQLPAYEWEFSEYYPVSVWDRVQAQTVEEERWRLPEAFLPEPAPSGFGAGPPLLGYQLTQLALKAVPEGPTADFLKNVYTGINFRWEKFDALIINAIREGQKSVANAQERKTWLSKYFGWPMGVGDAAETLGVKETGKVWSGAYNFIMHTLPEWATQLLGFLATQPVPSPYYVYGLNTNKFCLMEQQRKELMM